jgi:hypothetical protein
MKIEDLIIPGILVIGAYIVLTKFKDLFNPASAASGAVGAVNAGVIQPAVQAGTEIVTGGEGVLNLPGNIVNNNVPGIARNAVDILGGLGNVPVMGGLLLGNPFVNAAMTGLKAASTPVKATAIKPSPHTKTPSPLKIPEEKGPITIGRLKFIKSSTGSINIVQSWIKPPIPGWKR